MSPRVRAFVIVGAIGFVTQIVVLAVLTRAGVPLPLATALAVEAAVLHNFVWHQRWTWRDRGDDAGWVRPLLRFHSINAVASIGVNVVLTWAIARWFHMPAPVANALAVVAAAGVNFVAADRWVFVRRASAAATVCLLAMSTTSEASAPTSALNAWDAYVREAEGQRTTSQDACRPDADPVGEATKVDGGTIYRWSGCTIIKGTTVPALVGALVSAGTPPPQDDVLESRVLGRDGERLRVYLKLRRHAIVTVSYDTEHDVTFTRASDTLASSRSVSTAITQIDGGDRGFLWKLNSYWVYRQVGQDVRVSLVSLSLSRDVPLLVRPMAGPIIASVARDSVIRTLAAVKRFAESKAV